VPISSTLDTPGPMTKNIIDNAILLSALTGFDETDPKSTKKHFAGIVSAGLHLTNFKDMRLGAMVNLIESDSIYAKTINKLKELGAEIIEFKPPEIELENFLTILNIDMRNDLPAYLIEHSNPEKVKIKSVADAVQFNASDSLVRIPYGQVLFKGILKDSTTTEELEAIKSNLEKKGRLFFDTAMDAHKLDAVLSINNYHASYAAVAKYPALTVPMGYKTTGEPISLTFIGKQFKEAELLRLGAAFEKAFQARKIPKGYE